MFRTHNFKFITVILLLPLILTTIWFRNGLIHGGGEEGIIYYNPQKTLKLSSAVWSEFTTGSSIAIWLVKSPVIYIATLFEKMGFPSFFFQAVLFFILMEIGVFSVYFLTLDFLEKNEEKNLISLISAIFYLLNPFSFSQVWGRSLSTQYFAFSLLPLALLFFCLGIKRKKYVFGLLIALISVVMATAYEFLTFIMVFWFVLLIYFVYKIFISREKTKEIFFGVKFISLTFVLWSLFNCWWLVPLITSFGSVYTSASSGPGDNVGSLLGVSRSFTPEVIIRLLQKGYFFDSTAYSQIYSTIFFQLISFIPVFFVIIGIVKILKNHLLIGFRFFVLLLVLGLLVSLGANPPFGWLFVWVFKSFTPLQAFRNPFEKFGLVYVLGYCPVFAYGVVSFLEKKRFRNLTVASVFILTFGIYAWPMWTGRVIAGSDKKIGLDIPTYYKDLRNFLKDRADGYRLFMTPIWSGVGAYYQWGDAARYQGSDPMVFMLDQNVISNSAQGAYYYDFITNFRKYMDQENLTPALSLLRTKYLIDRQDAILITGKERNHYRSLTSVVYPPLGKESSLKVICSNITADSKTNNLAWIVCHIPKEDRDLSNIKYLHVKIKTDHPAEVRIALRDNKDVRINWNGRVDSDYRTYTNDFQYITLPLGAPTENDSSIDLSNTDILEVWANIQGSLDKSVGEINVSEIKLDPGTQKEINEFKKIAQFGKLTVFEPLNFNPPPEFGSLSSIDKVKDFVQLFEDVNKNRNQTDRKGFVLVSQNSQKDLQNLPNETYIQTSDKYKVSDTRYWLKVSEASSAGLLLLSKTFDPHWKVIAGVNKDKLSGSFFNDWQLLKKAVLSEDNHYVVNGYANLWKIDGKAGDYSIVFMPQIIADLSFEVSKFAVVTPLGILIALILIKIVKSTANNI